MASPHKAITYQHQTGCYRIVNSFITAHLSLPLRSTMYTDVMFGMISTLISCGKAQLASYITVYLFTKILTFIYHIILRRCEEHDTTECIGLQGDALLFAQPPPNDDCPICFLPLPASFSATSTNHVVERIFAMVVSMVSSNPRRTSLILHAPSVEVPLMLTMAK